MFVYQPTFNTFELKEDKDTEYVTGCKPKSVYTSKLIPLYTTFLHKIKRFKYKTRFYKTGFYIQNTFIRSIVIFRKSILVVEKNNYATAVVYACIVYDLDDWKKVFLTILH